MNFYNCVIKNKNKNIKKSTNRLTLGPLITINHLVSPTVYDKIKTTSIHNIYLIFTLHVDFKIQRINVYFKVRFSIENSFIAYL